jgi:uncharacterized membrane protein
MRTFLNRHMGIMVAVVFVIVVIAAFRSHQAAKDADALARASGIKETNPEGGA